LYIVDNSPEPALDTLRRDERIRYIFPGKNLGFGAGHNLVLREVQSDYHVIINPDVYFGPEGALSNSTVRSRPTGRSSYRQEYVRMPMAASRI
jgi:GT2 family glycosyltransferase